MGNVLKIWLERYFEHFEENGEVCPAGWQKGKPGMNASPNGVAEFLAQHSEAL